MKSETQALQAVYTSLLSTGDVNALVKRCYTSDARLHSFRFQASGSEALAAVLTHAGRKRDELGHGEIQLLIDDRDFIWQETAFPDAPSAPAVYDFMFLHEGKIRLHLVGDKQGLFWLADEFAGEVPEDQSAAQSLHHRYIEFEAQGDADGLADEFYTADARVVTAKLKIEGQEALRSFFARKFENESGFHLVSIRNLVGDGDYVWFEATAASSEGSRTVYDVMLLQDDKVNLQLVGTLGGVLPANRSA